jgi:hypothetical protein
MVEELEVALLQQEVVALQEMTEREQQLVQMMEKLQGETVQDLVAAIKCIRLQGTCNFVK